jgi:hypothetical protein
MALGTWYNSWTSLVHTPAPNPYTVSLAMAMASSVVLKVATQTTGPKISSCYFPEATGKNPTQCVALTQCWGNTRNLARTRQFSQSKKREKHRTL